MSKVFLFVAAAVVVAIVWLGLMPMFGSQGSAYREEFSQTAGHAIEELDWEEEQRIKESDVTRKMRDLVDDNYRDCTRDNRFWTKLYQALLGQAWEIPTSCPESSFIAIVNSVRAMILDAAGQAVVNKWKSVVDFVFYGR